MTHKLIQTNIQDKDSLTNAILEFKSQMIENYKTGELINKVGGFVKEDDKLFTRDDLLDKEQIRQILSFGNINDPDFSYLGKLSSLNFEELHRQDVYLRFSHLLVFQYALEHEDLKEIVIEFCKELVEYSIAVGTSNELFFSSDSYFGIYLLVLLVEKENQYSYLIGEFITPNSDYNQIKYHCASYITYLFYKYSYADFILDIFASCRFAHLSLAMSEDYVDEEKYSANLLKHFLDDESRYEYFKNSLFESLKKRPMNPKDMSVFTTFENDYVSLEIEYEEEGLYQEDFEDFIFYGKTFEEHKIELQSQMFEIVKDVLLKDLYYYSEPILDEKLKLNDIENDPFYQEYDEENEYETNRDFFLTSFENGQRIFDYIEENKNPSILDELKQTNILKLAFDNKLHIYKRFEYFGSGGFKLSGTLEDELSLEDILDKFIMPYESPESFDLQDDGEEEQNEKCLRVIDVLIRLLGKKELSADEIKLIVDDNELCSKEEAQKRFTDRKSVV